MTMAPVKYGDKLPPRRLGMTTNATPGIGSERTLGPAWPEAWKSTYQPGSFVGKIGAERAKALKVAQRLHELNQRARLDKATGRNTLPDVAVRRQLARADQAALKQAYAARQAVSDQVFGFQLDLRPFDFSKSTLHEVNLRNRYLDRLAAAKNDGERLKLMEANSGYREAALQGHHSLSGLSPENYARAYQAEMKRKFPVETQTIADANMADEILDHVLKAASEAVSNELRALGEPLEQPAPPAPSAPWE
jgi:hypothetical protein